MAADILHIKDSFYFEVPRGLWASDRKNAEEFYESYGPWVIRNDAEYQSWEAERQISELKEIVGDDKPFEHLTEQWHAWQDADHLRHGRPLDQFLSDEMTGLQADAQKWAEKNADPDTRDVVEAYMAEQPEYEFAWMYRVISNPEKNKQWLELRSKYDQADVVEEYLEAPNTGWSQDKIEAYNLSLSGKVFIPQPFATLRNAYETQSGFGISRYIVIEIVVAILLLITFRWLAKKVASGESPTGKLWNLLESFVEFVRNNVVVPAMGEHDADRFMPLFWTLFMFILGCNLAGMIPWVGAPTSVLATTGALALIVLGVGVVCGVRKFGVVGYLKNLSPSLGLPLYLAVIIVPIVWVIEAFSLFIKHGVLAARLLFNMVAGHLVLIGIIGIGFSIEAAAMNTGMWGLVAVISVVGATLLSFLELFVAFLQAYIFTFLAALFIGNAIHHH